MKFQDDISNMNTHTHTDKPKPICPPLFQSWGHNNDFIGIKRPLILGTEHLKPINLLKMAINKKIIRVFDIVHYTYTDIKVSF